MENNDNTKRNFAEIDEIISSIDKSNDEHGNLDFGDTFDNAASSLILILNVNSVDFQNKITEEMNENNGSNNNDLNSILNDIHNWHNDFISSANGHTTENFQNGLTIDDAQFQFTTISSLFHEDRFQMQHSIEKRDHNIELKQLDRLDDAWENQMNTLRTNENCLTRRNVPRLMLFSNKLIICNINCTLQMLLNAPVFIRVIRKLQKISEKHIDNLQSIQNVIHIENVRAKRNLFCALSKIIKMALEENQNSDADVSLLQSFCDIYGELCSCMNYGTQGDPDEFYIHLMDSLELVAREMNHNELYSKAFEIISSISIDDNEPTVKKDRAIHVLPNNCDFLQYINEHYTGTVTERDGKHTIERIYGPLPEQLWVTTERQQIGNHVPYPSPAEFITRHDQRYLFTGAIMSLNCGHWNVLVRRQDCVYLYNDHRLVDRFHINYLPIFFKAVHGRALLYTEVDPEGEHVCIFEDPMSGIYAGKPSNGKSCHCITEILETSIQSNISMTSVDGLSVIIRHPILTTFRYYMHSDFDKKNINVDIPILKDCVDQSPLYFWPRSMFAGSFVEFTLIFKAPDGKFYRSHYQFVLKGRSGVTFENPTYVRIQTDNDEWFPVTLTISKPTQNALLAKDKCTNETDHDNQDHDICQFVDYPDGKKEKIDQKKLLSFTKDNKKNKTRTTRLNNKSGNVTPFRLSKVIDLNTLYLAVRKVRRLSDQKKYLPVSDVLFCSNPFKPVSASVKKHEYDYSSNLLKITELNSLPTVLSHETIIGTIQLSYLIPEEMFKCTSLKDKYIKVTIITGSEEEPRVHPNYQILDEQNRVSSKIFPANQYASTLTINIVKNTMDSFQNDSKLPQTLHNSSIGEQNTAIPIVTSDIKTTYTTPDMSSFRFHLELCHFAEDGSIIYLKSTVISEEIIDESVSQEKQVLRQSLEIDNTESNDVLINDPSLHVKRPLNEESNASSDISSIKHPKVT